jgi:hypothetical protein
MSSPLLLLYSEKKKFIFLLICNNIIMSVLVVNYLCHVAQILFWMCNYSITLFLYILKYFC